MGQALKLAKENKPVILVIFGITGDLSTRYLLPALYHLLQDGLLHPKTRIVGVTRRDIGGTELLKQTSQFVAKADGNTDADTLKKLGEQLRIRKMDLAKGPDYDQLLTYLNDIETEQGVCMDRLYYLSIPPGASEPVVANLGTHGLNKSCQHGNAATRLLVEKPFGYDLVSARELIDATAEHFSETQIYRIDHYLAKETVQNILTFRFHNPVFEAIWDRGHIASIDILASEQIGIEGRAVFYESTGALRDFVQSHLLQLLAVTTMERPHSMSSEDIRAARLKLLESVKPVPRDKIYERTVRGQYDGYRAEAGNTRSDIETYAALQLYIDNPRWHDVPATIRTGKALDKRDTEITVTFRQTDSDAHTNSLKFYVQPNEGIGIDLFVKRPGFENQVQSATMDFNYARSFVGHQYDHPNAYEYVLVDAVRGDRTLFASSDEVLASWRILQPVLETWSKNGDNLQTYKQGSTGPELKFLSTKS